MVRQTLDPMKGKPVTYKVPMHAKAHACDKEDADAPVTRRSPCWKTRLSGSVSFTKRRFLRHGGFSDRRVPEVAMLEFRDQICANAAIAAMQAATLHQHKHADTDDVYGPDPVPDHDVEDDDGEDDVNHRKRKHDLNAAAAWNKNSSRGNGVRPSAGLPKGAAAGKDGLCRNQTGYIGVRQRKWGMFAAEIRDGDKRRWLGSFSSGRDAGLAYDAAAISQKGSKAKTNFRYHDFLSCPRTPAETVESVRWDLLPKDISERFPIPNNPCGNGARDASGGFDSAPSSRGCGRSAGGRGVDQQASEPDTLGHDAAEQPTKRSRSASFGTAPAAEHAPDAGGRHSAASYPAKYDPHGRYGGEDPHLGHPGGYYAYPPGAHMRQPAEEEPSEDAEYAAALYHHQQQYMMGAPTHGGAPGGGGALVPAHREPSGGSSQPSNSAGRGSPCGSNLPPAATAMVVASAASRAAAITAYESLGHHHHAPYGMSYPMHYAPNTYRPPHGRMCTVSDGGVHSEYPPAYMARGGGAGCRGGGGRPHSDGERSCEDGGGGGGGFRLPRTSEESLPLGSLGLEGGDAAAFDEMTMEEAHPMLVHYADSLGPYGGYEHPGYMMGHGGHHHHLAPLPGDGEEYAPMGPAPGRLGAEMMHHHHHHHHAMIPGCPDGMPAHGGYRGPAPYGAAYLEHQEYEAEMVGEGDEVEGMTSGWQPGYGPVHSHEELDALMALQNIVEPLPCSSVNPMHALEGAHAIVAAAAAAAAAQQLQHDDDDEAGCGEEGGHEAGGGEAPDAAAET